MYLSDVDHFPDALSQAANRWVGVESVPTFNRSVDERQNISAKNIEDKKLFSLTKTNNISLQKKEEHICQKQRYKVLLPTNIKTKYFCQRHLKTKISLLKKFQPFSPRMRTPSKLPLFAIAAAILASPVMCIVQEIFIVFLKKGTQNIIFQRTSCRAVSTGAAVFTNPHYFLE